MARRKKHDARVLGLGDPELMARLKTAAEAAGVETVEQLVDLVVDSGVSARPPVDHLTERFTLEDLGSRLWTVAATEPRTRRREWYAGLAPAQQVALVTTLRHRGLSSHAIGNDLGIEDTKVEKIYAEHATKMGSQVLGIRLDTLVGQMFAAKQRAQEISVAKGDSSAYWRIEKDYVGLLQDLGVVSRAIHRVEVVNKAEEVKAAQMKRLVDIAEKRATRKVELLTVEVEKVDPLPEAIEADYEELKTS